MIDEHFSQRTHLQIDVFAGRDHFGKVDIKNKVRALYLGHGHRRNRNLGVIIDIVAAINALSLARFCKLINIPDGRAVPRIALKARKHVDAVGAVLFHASRRSGHSRLHDVYALLFGVSNFRPFDLVQSLLIYRKFRCGSQSDILFLRGDGLVKPIGKDIAVLLLIHAHRFEKQRRTACFRCRNKGCAHQRHKAQKSGENDKQFFSHTDDLLLNLIYRIIDLIFSNEKIKKTAAAVLPP